MMNGIITILFSTRTRLYVAIVRGVEMSVRSVFFFFYPYSCVSLIRWKASMGWPFLWGLRNKERSEDFTGTLPSYSNGTKPRNAASFWRRHGWAWGYFEVSMWATSCMLNLSIYCVTNGEKKKKKKKANHFRCLCLELLLIYLFCKEEKKKWW